MKRLSSTPSRAARLSRDVEAVGRSVETRSPAPIARRARNVTLGRLIGRAGGWRWLWGGRR